MKISDPNGTPLRGLDVSKGVTSARGGRQPGKSTQSAVADQIQLSDLSASLASTRSESPAHLAKLSSLAAVVSSSRYVVDPYLVSASIIQHTLQFGEAAYYRS
jgi:hypothetical protein